MAERMKIILLERNDADAQHLIRLLEDSPLVEIEVTRISRLEDSLSMKVDGTLQVLLLSLEKTDSSALKTYDQIRLAFPRIPVIVLAEKDDLQFAYELSRRGAQDYLIKGEIKKNSFIRIVLLAVERHRAGQQSFSDRLVLDNLIHNLPGIVYRCRNDPEYTMDFIGGGCKSLTGYEPQDFIGSRLSSFGDIIHPEDREMVWSEIQQAITQGRQYRLEYRILTREGEEKWVWEQGFAVDRAVQPEILEGYITDITDKRLREFQMLTMLEIGRIIRGAVRMKEMFTAVLNQLQNLYAANCAAIGLVADSPGTVLFEKTLGIWQSLEGKTIDVGDCFFYQKISQLEKVVLDTEKDAEQTSAKLKCPISHFMTLIPIAQDGRLKGLIVMGRDSRFSDQDPIIFQAVADMLSTALERMELHRRTERQLKRLESLHAIDLAITGVFDIEVVNSIILDQIRKELNADAADIFLLDRITNSLERYGGFGSRSFKGKTLSLPLGDSIAGSVLVERRGIRIPDLEKESLKFVNRDPLSDDFRAYFASPLIVRGEAMGVLEVFFPPAFSSG